MIFNNNSTSLGSLDIPMAEGYDCSTGVALALIESARNDMAMFQAMLDVDAKELSIANESAGYVQENEIMALQEAAIGSIWKKIKELFTKLIAKIKSIFHTFMSKINSLFMSDKQMVNKYEKEIRAKSNIGKMKVKWADVNNKGPLADDKMKPDKMTDLNPVGGDLTWQENQDTEDRENAVLTSVFGGGRINDITTLEEDYDEYYFDDATTVELEDAKIDGQPVNIARDIIDYLRGKDLTKINSVAEKMTRALGKVVKDADTEYKKALSNEHGVDKTDADAKKIAEEATTNASHKYDLSVIYQSVMLKVISCWTNAVKKDYKQRKAVFMKAIAVNNKKLEESSVYADAIAEAAANEVEDVISGALSNEELSKICNASKNVKDADVSDDPSKLTYGPDSYYDNMSYTRTAGSIDSNINSKSESALFSSLIY